MLTFKEIRNFEKLKSENRLVPAYFQALQETEAALFLGSNTLDSHHKSYNCQKTLNNFRKEVKIILYNCNLNSLPS